MRSDETSLPPTNEKAEMQRRIAKKIEDYEGFVHKVEEGLDQASATLSAEAVRLNGKDAFTEYREHLAANTDDGFSDEAKFGARTPFQIDRDRILYSSFFMPLALKTQMIIGQHTSLLRNRLSHTLIVVNIARSIAQGLRLNDALTEAIALGHDIGHVPFGHAGERTLNKWLHHKVIDPQNQGTFDFAQVMPGAGEHFLLQDAEPTEDPEWRSRLFRHGRQSVKKLEVLEHKPTNLTRKTLFGIWRHSGSLAGTDATFNYVFPGGAGQLDHDDSSYEAQVVRLADDIAWVVHDLDDAMRAKLVSRDDVMDRSLCPSEPDDARTVVGVLGRYEAFIGPWVRRFISGVVDDNRERNGRPLNKAFRNDPGYHLGLSKPLRDALNSLADLIREKVQEDAETLRAEEAVDRLLSSLADCHWGSSAEFAVDLKRVLDYRGQTESGLSTLVGRLAKRQWTTPAQRPGASSAEGKESEIERAALICDFLSALTDEEAAMLWEWHYSPRFRLAPAFAGAGPAARSTKRKEG